MGKIIDNIKSSLAYGSSKRKKLNVSKIAIDNLSKKPGKLSDKGKINYEAEQAFFRDVKKARNSQDLANRISNNKSKYCTWSGQIPLKIVLYPVLGRLDDNIYKYVPINTANKLLDHKFTPRDLNHLKDTYSDILVDYISNHNVIKNNLLPMIKNNVTDYTVAFDKKQLNSIFERIQNPKLDEKTSLINNQVQTFSIEVLYPFMTLYSKEDILNNKDLIEFEMKNGYFDKYYSAMMNNEEIPSLEERKKIFNDQSNLTPDQVKLFQEATILQEKISMLNNDKAIEKLSTALKSAVKEKDYSKIEKVHEFYQKIYKEEIVRALYSPENDSISVLEEFDDLKTIMIHSFFRNPDSILKRYEEKVRKEIIENRKDNSQDASLTAQEQKILDGKMEKAKNELANQTVVNKTFDMSAIYSDANGFTHYQSNTSNQISASIISPENILELQSSVGIGFDKKGVPSENIVISSPRYLTTNKGLNNLELPGSILSSASSTLKEMEASTLNEVVMKRNGEHYSTKASYVFVAITQNDVERDKENLERGKKLAKENHLPLVVLNIPKLKKSHDEMQQQTNKR